MSVINSGLHVPVNGQLDQTNLMALANNLRTGSLVLDMLLMTVLSSVITVFFSLFTWDNAKKIGAWLQKKFFTKTPKPLVHYNKLVIQHEQSFDCGGKRYGPDDDYMKYNHHLFDAVYQYMNEHLNDMSEAQTGISVISHASNWRTMRDYKFRFRPIQQVKIGDFYLDFNKKITNEKELSENENDEDNKNNAKKGRTGTYSFHHYTITIQSCLPMIKIREFLDKIYQNYIEDRYPKPPPTEESLPPKYYFVKSNCGTKFKVYDLKSQTTFDDIFFPGKEKLVRKLKLFKEGKTKLSKFTILLHGPPGGGKSSFIKALHTLTHTSVIVVKLSQFTQLQDLVELFHNIYIYDTDGNHYKIPINDRIYLFEDIDAEDKIVLKRKKDKKTGKNDKNSQDNKDSNDDSSSSSDEMSQLWGSFYKKGKSFGPGYGGYSGYDGGYPKGKKGMHSYPDYSPSIKLADILNLLDGVLELNGCYIVMTTNHIEKLDPALIRPGRITYRQKLGALVAPDMRPMIRKFLSASLDEWDAHPKQKADLDGLLEGVEARHCMPCRFEAMVQHEDSMVDVVSNLRKYLDRNGES